MHDYQYHAGFNRLFSHKQLTLGFILPLNAYPHSAVPTLDDQAGLLKLTDEAGFAGLWARDVPLLDPKFGDGGQLYDPFAYLSYAAALTRKITLATGSAVLTLRHPLHLAKQANSVDQLSNGRFVLGISSGDREIEYPAFGVSSDYVDRGERFTEAFHYFRKAAQSDFPQHSSPRFGELDGTTNMLPKAYREPVPVIVTGSSRQNITWISEHSDAWLYYFIEARYLAPLLKTWQEASQIHSKDGRPKPFAQGLFLDLAEDPDFPVTHIHSGMRVGRNTLIDYLDRIQGMGVNHMAFNLKLSKRPALEVISELATYVLPHFPSN